MDNLDRLGSRIGVPIPADDLGYTGRECPNGDCQGFFKVMFGTGVGGEVPCHCPYCGHTAGHESFATDDQIEYAKSYAFRLVSDALTKDLKALEFEHKPRGPFGIGVSMKLKASPRPSLHQYREPQLETYVECDECTLKYAVYGVFAFCPDCGKHNSLQILKKNFELVEKLLAFAANSEPELSARLVENALEDCVSSFDGFGRELCRIHAERSSSPQKAEKVSFQNLEGARKALSQLFAFDIGSALSPEEWKQCVESFEKRHLIAHKMGVADSAYVEKVGASRGVRGRKVAASSDEVRGLVQLLTLLASRLCESLDDVTKRKRDGKDSA